MLNSQLSVAKRELFAGRFREAHAAAQAVLRENSQEHEGVLVMAAIAVEHGNIVGAEKLTGLLEQAGNQSCWLAVLQSRIALMKQDQEAARKFALKAHEAGSDDPHIANQLGVALSRGGFHAKAVQPLRTAVAGVPDNADYRHNLALALQFAGELEEAEAQYRALVASDPGHAKAWLALVQLAKQPDPDWASVLEGQFAAAGENPEARLIFGHARARLAENVKEWDASFDWLERAKKLKHAETKHDRPASEVLTKAAIAAAGSAKMELEPSGDERPIFIVGMPRSGTTLVERILTSHSQVTSVGELSDFAIELKKASQTSGEFVLDPAVLRAASQMEDLSEVGTRYLKRASALAGGASRFIDKMPFNVFFVPAILRALPGARVICLRRSPFDVLMANYRQLFATGFTYYSYNYDFGDAAHFVAQFEKLANAFESVLPQGRFTSVHYEGVIADQRGETERLLEFCGLEWEDACMEFHRNAEPVATASSVQVRSPLYSSSLGQWRRYTEASKRALEEFAKYGISPESV